MNITKESSLNYNLTFAIASFGATFVRLGIAFFIGVSLLLGYAFAKELAIFGTITIMILDYYDGVWFKKSQLNEIKSWRVNRRILDSVTDRILIQVVCLAVLITSFAFLPFYLIILIREISISSYVTQHFKNNILLYPGPIAKLACVLIGSTVIFYLAFNVVLSTFVLISMLITSVLAFNEYREAVKSSRNYPDNESSASYEII